MSRRAGQMTATGTLAIIGALMVGVVAVIGLCDWLLVDAATTDPLGATAQEPSTPPGEVDCPTAAELPSPVVPVQTSAAQLVDCPDVFDGRRVLYAGEAVSALLRRGARTWVQLNDDPYALDLGPLPEHRTTVGGNSGMSVSVPTAVAADIEHVGGSRARGDILAVAGVFLAADPDDGGAMAIEADAARITEPGHPVGSDTSVRRAVTAMALAAATVLFAAAVTVRRRHR